ncbi:MAG: hypothetical protein Q9167_006838 [Letrouitia subvulpina]
MSSLLTQERSFTQTIASLAPPPESHEHIMPGALYVLVAAMSASIATRNRNIPLRATVPFGVGLGAAWLLLPVTMRNIGDLAWKYEEKVPVLAENHVRIRGATTEGWKQIKIRGEQAKSWSSERVRTGQVGVETFKGASAETGLVSGPKAKATNKVAAFMTSGYKFVCTEASQEDTVDISKPTKKALGPKRTKS